MNTDPRTRLVAALDRSPDSLAALEATARLAAMLQRPVLALHALAHDKTDPLPARLAADMAITCKVPIDFREEQGNPATLFTSLSRAALLTAAGRKGTGASCCQHLGSTAMALLEEPESTVLLWKKDASPTDPFLIVNDGSPHAERALKAAALFAPLGVELHMFVTGSSAARDVERLEQEARILMPERHERITIHPVPWNDPMRLAQCIGMTEQGTLVIAKGSPVAQKGKSAELARYLDYPILAAC